MREPTFHHRAVWTGAFGGFVMTFAWFHGLFRDPFLRGLGRAPEDLGDPHTLYDATILQFAGCLISAYVIAWLFKHFKVERVSEGSALVVILWVGLVAAVATPIMMAAGFVLYFLAICAGGVLAQMLVMGGVIAAWRRKVGPQT